MITDLKTSRDTSPVAFARTIIAYGYDIQAAAYVSAVEHVRPEQVGRVRYQWIVAEIEEPYAVARIVPSESMMAHGRARWARALAIWERCLRTGTWPGYEIDPPTIIGAPAGAMAELMAGVLEADVEAMERSIP